ncbi:hypothetical protein DFS34DRAFT_599177 [Phlyctochytrium arcticum]|nr:hypothetical protein DFS34DRAFT_599177 [Phlyctochytrium arcticum]
MDLCFALLMFLFFLSPPTKFYETCLFWGFEFWERARLRFLVRRVQGERRSASGAVGDCGITSAEINHRAQWLSHQMSILYGYHYTQRL